MKFYTVLSFMFLVLILPVNGFSKVQETKMEDLIVKIDSISFGLIYVDNLEKALQFYQKYFGFKTKFTMDNETAHYGSAGKINLWIGSGYKKQDTNENSAHLSMMFEIDSVGTLFENLKKDGLRVVQDKPIEMQTGIYWLQFEDPAGNILEVLGGK